MVRVHWCGLGWKTLEPTLRNGIGELPELSPKIPTKKSLLGAARGFYFAKAWKLTACGWRGVTPDTL